VKQATRKKPDRWSNTDEALIVLAPENALATVAKHSFVILLGQRF
jgi:adenosine/AMP kinase